MSPEEARVGTWVQVWHGHRKPEFRGRVGKIVARWGAPTYTALDVILEDDRSELFWHHELEAVEATALAAWWQRLSFYDGG